MTKCRVLLFGLKIDKRGEKQKKGVEKWKM